SADGAPFLGLDSRPPLRPTAIAQPPGPIAEGGQRLGLDSPPTIVPTAIAQPPGPIAEGGQRLDLDSPPTIVPTDLAHNRLKIAATAIPANGSTFYASLAPKGRQRVYTTV
ncbi:MAG: hypothetical protein LBJ61_12955, partial [Deltaproteobacteria bacterium]|nr:hypothetical protein [Deltaproteobacteria bacterium]